MSIQHKNIQHNPVTDEQEALTSPATAVTLDMDGTTSASPAPATWQPLTFVRQWFQTNTFSPVWLPKYLRQPRAGYITAVLLQAAAILITMLLLLISPHFAFAGLLEALAIALTALTWGAGPGALSIISGLIFFNIAALTPPLHQSSNFIDSLIEQCIFLLIGLAICVVASQAGRARQNAEELATSLVTERTRLNAIIETVPDVVAIYDIQGNVVQMNQAGREKIGPARINMNVHDMPDAFDVQTAEGKPFPPTHYPFAQVLNGETVSSVEMRYTGLHKQETNILVSAAPLYDVEGTIEGVVCITHDITELRRTEQEAITHARELEAIFDAITDGIFVINSDNQVLRINSAFRTMLGLTPENEAAYFAKSVTERQNALTMRAEDGTPLPYEQWPQSRILRGEILTGAKAQDVLFQRLDDQTAQISVSGAPIYDNEGNITAALCICRDMTERKYLERRTQETLDALLSMAEALVLAPENEASTGELLPATASKVAQRIAELTCSVLGCQRVGISAIEPETEIMHPVAVTGLPPEQEQQWWAEQPQDVRFSDTSTPELVERLRNNEILIIDMTQPPFNEVPNPFNVQIVLVAPMCIGTQLVGLLTLDYGGDTHEYSENELALTKAVAKLGALVIERERLLRERAEARASELALREANRRMDEFLGMTSHELKTPLTSIKGNTQLTVRQLKTSLQSIQNMQSMMESTERQIRLLDRLVDDLLDISRTQASQLDLDPVSCDLTPIVQEIVAEQQRIRPSRAITLDVATDEHLPINADAARVTQVVTNYLTNALKYSPDSTPVEVILRQQDAQAYFAVRDEGPGLTPEEQQQIWERFHRVHGTEISSSSLGSSAGLGLGLYISKIIIEQHGGQVGVESAPGEGALFWFTLPLA